MYSRIKHMSECTVDDGSRFYKYEREKARLHPVMGSESGVISKDA